MCVKYDCWPDLRMGIGGEMGWERDEWLKNSRLELWDRKMRPALQQTTTPAAPCSSPLRPSLLSDISASSHSSITTKHTLHISRRPGHTPTSYIQPQLKKLCFLPTNINCFSVHSHPSVFWLPCTIAFQLFHPSATYGLPTINFPSTTLLHHFLNRTSLPIWPKYLFTFSNV